MVISLLMLLNFCSFSKVPFAYSDMATMIFVLQNTLEVRFHFMNFKVRLNEALKALQYLSVLIIKVKYVLKGSETIEIWTIEICTFEIESIDIKIAEFRTIRARTIWVFFFFLVRVV